IQSLDCGLPKHKLKFELLTPVTMLDSNLMRRLLLITTVLLLLGVAGQVVAAKETWISVRSKNFFLIGNASEKEIRQVAERLEQFREVASHLFVKANQASPVPTRVVVFKNDASYRPFKPNAYTAGYFQPGPDVN